MCDASKHDNLLYFRSGVHRMFTDSLLPMPFDLLHLGHVPKVRPYWRADYVSPSVGCFERPSTCLRSLTGLNVSKVFGRPISDASATGSNSAQPQQRCASCAEGVILPARVLAAGIPFLVLQDPLQRITHYPPTRVELG